MTPKRISSAIDATGLFETIHTGATIRCGVAKCDSEIVEGMAMTLDFLKSGRAICQSCAPCLRYERQAAREAGEPLKDVELFDR